MTASVARRARSCSALAWLCAALLGCGGAAEEAAPASAASTGPGVEEALAGWLERTRELRELPFERPVELVRLAPEDVPELMRQQIEQELTPERARADAAAYAALGLLPPDFDLYGTLVEIYGDQVSGLYDPREERLYVVEGGEDGSGYGFEVVAVHELVHALQHQHFPDTIRVQLGLAHNSDLSAMLSVVTEGDASLAAFALSPTHGRSPQALRPVRDAMMQEIDSESGPYARAPRALRLRFVLPYAEGLWLAAQRHARGGMAAVDDWVRDPPLSTLSLLAEAPPDADTRPIEFVGFPLEWLRESLQAQSCRLGTHDVVGPLWIAALLAQHGGEAADAVARSWAGGRMLHASCEDGEELLWLTRWQSDGAAARFAAAYLQVADAIQEQAGLASAPRIAVSDRGVAVRTARFEALAEPLERRIERRRYGSFGAWVADGCFPSAACPDVSPHASAAP